MERTTDAAVSQKENSHRLTTRILVKLRPEHFRLSSDSGNRKARFLWRLRRTLLLELRNYSDSDGRNVRPAVATLAKGLGWSERNVFRKLDDLKSLDLLIDEASGGYNKPRSRRLNLVRAAELLGVPVERPPDVPTDLSNAVLAMMLEPEADADETRNLLDALRHLLHLQPRELILQMARCSLGVGWRTLDWMVADDFGCADESCPICRNSSKAGDGVKSGIHPRRERETAAQRLERRTKEAVDAAFPDVEETNSSATSGVSDSTL